MPGIDVRHLRRRKAFTLLELTLAIALTGLMAGVAVLSLRTPLAKVRFESAVEQIVALDRLARCHADRHGQACLLNIDMPKRQLQVFSDGKSPRRPAFTARLGTHVTVDQMQYPGYRVGVDGGEIRFSERGDSPTYALRIGDHSHAEWLVFLGTTGQSMRIPSDEEFHDLREILWP